MASTVGVGVAVDGERGLADVEVTYVAGWFDHPRFIEANAGHVEAALDRLPAALRAGARLVFTAHSVPLASADRSRYREQLLESSRLVAARLNRPDWALVYQSRSGRPEDPWLEPDVCDHLRALRAGGVEAVVVSPIGFVCDHIEVLYDLDREAAAVAEEIGLVMTRAAAVNDAPAFLEMMADVVQQLVARYAHGRPLPLVPAAGAALASAARRG